MSPLYDTAADLVLKAMRGLGMSASEACTGTELDPDELISLIRQEAPSASFRPVAFNLGLSPDALVYFDEPWQEITSPHQLRRIILPFEGETVNVWILEHPEGSLVIDAGFTPSDLDAAWPSLPNFKLLVTHPHRDHIGGLPILAPLAEQSHAPIPLDGCQMVQPGQQLHHGAWTIDVVDLRGHHLNTVGYRIRGAGLDLAAVGDALFARSAGGCANEKNFQIARQTLMSFWHELDDETLLLSGHGPLTQASREAKQNPFVRGWLESPVKD